MKLKGIVRLEVVISAAGRVASVKSVGGHPLLAQSATQAVKAWGICSWAARNNRNDQY